MTGVADSSTSSVSSRTPPAAARARDPCARPVARRATLAGAAGSCASPASSLDSCGGRRRRVVGHCAGDGHSASRFRSRNSAAERGGQGALARGGRSGDEPRRRGSPARGLAARGHDCTRVRPRREDRERSRRRRRSCQSARRRHVLRHDPAPPRLSGRSRLDCEWKQLRWAGSSPAAGRSSGTTSAPGSSSAAGLAPRSRATATRRWWRRARRGSGRATRTRRASTASTPQPDEVRRRCATYIQVSGLAVGAGSVWASDAINDVVVRIDPRTAEERARMPAAAAHRLAFGYGALWAVSERPRSGVWRIDPATNGAVAHIPVTTPRKLDRDRSRQRLGDEQHTRTRRPRFAHPDRPTHGQGDGDYSPRLQPRGRRRSERAGVGRRRPDVGGGSSADRAESWLNVPALQKE